MDVLVHLDLSAIVTGLDLVADTRRRRPWRTHTSRTHRSKHCLDAILLVGSQFQNRLQIIVLKLVCEREPASAKWPIKQGDDDSEY